MQMCGPRSDPIQMRPLVPPKGSKEISLLPLVPPCHCQIANSPNVSHFIRRCRCHFLAEFTISSNLQQWLVFYRHQYGARASQSGITFGCLKVSVSLQTQHAWLHSTYSSRVPLGRGGNELSSR